VAVNAYPVWVQRLNDIPIGKVQRIDGQTFISWKVVCFIFGHEKILSVKLWAQKSHLFAVERFFNSKKLRFLTTRFVYDACT
jgi:hypothetical protein